MTTATASSLQREPSMEEILASIRRIIEDSDTARSQPESEAVESQDSQPQEAPVTVEVDAFRAEFRTAPRMAPFDDAKVDAQLAATLDERVAPATMAEVSAQLSAENAVDLPPGDAPLPGWLAAKSESGEHKPVPDNAYSLTQTTVSELPETEPAHEPVDVTGSRSALVSEQTGRKVAAAFGELSEAFASRSKKTFDDKAEEMLKPMLQDWLDNNLPTLVERLVREEIERVARGA